MKDAQASSDLVADAPESRAVSRHWYAPLLAVPTPAIFLVAAAIATWLLWRQGSLAQVGASLRMASPATILAILAAYASSIFVLGVRWHVLTRMAGGAPQLQTSAEVFLTSVIVNYAAPIGLAVPTRAALTVRDLGLTPAQSGAVVGWEVLLDVAALLAISAAWLVLGGSTLLQSAPLDERFALVAACVLIAGVVIMVVGSRISGVRDRLSRIVGPMIVEPLRRPVAALLSGLLTVAFWGVQLGVMSGLLSLFGVAPSPSLVTGMMGLPMLIGMLSPVPGGAGIREALMAASAQLEAAPAASVLMAAVAYRLALFVVTPVVWGGLRAARFWADRPCHRNGQRRS